MYLIADYKATQNNVQILGAVKRKDRISQSMLFKIITGEVINEKNVWKL